MGYFCPRLSLAALISLSALAYGLDSELCRRSLHCRMADMAWPLIIVDDILYDGGF